MKRLQKSYKAGAALAALAFIGLSPSAQAGFLNGYTGPFTLSLRSLDNGVQYAVTQVDDDLNVATPTVAQLTGTGSNTAVGAGTLNGLTQLDAFNAQGSDTWGVFQVTLVAGSSGNVYNEALDPFAYWGVFRATDIAVNVANSVPGGNPVQSVSSSGWEVDIYQLQKAGNFNIASTFTQVPSSNHLPGNGFGGISVSTVPAPVAGPAPVLVLSLQGRAGVLGDPTSIGPNPGGTATELLTVFDTNAQTSEGTGWLDVLDTTNNLSGRAIGTENALFNTNGQLNQTDIKLQFNANQQVNWFTVQNPNGTSNWLLGNVDPAEGFAIPEPTTALAGFGCMLPLLGSFLRRRRDTRVAA